VFSPEALAMLAKYRFPGNVRELKNMVERALIRCGGRAVGVESLEFLDVGGHSPPVAAPAGETRPSTDLSLDLATVECQVIRRAMQTTGGNLSEAARLLGINRTKLHRKLAACPPVCP
jgi:DNA-binding NtrC family response regulator